MKDLRQVWKGALAILTVAGFFVGIRAIQPPLRHWNHARQVDAILRTDPLFATVVIDAPGVREPLRRAMIQALDTGRRDEAFVAGNRLLAPLLPKYLPRASDSAIVGFGRSLVAGLKALSAQDPDDCYRYLFPDVAGPPKRPNRTADNEMTNALREVMASARSSNARVDDSGGESLDLVYRRLHARHGEHLALLQQAETPSVDRELVCRIATDLYAEVIQLPEQEAARALRHLFAETP